MDVRVSAIISAYYAEEYLIGRLDNLMSQGEGTEVVVVMQRNSPETRAISEYRCFQSSPVSGCVVLTDSIPTIYEAWNLGIEASSGKYLTNANSDDRLYPGALSYLADALDNHPDAAVVYANSDIVTEIGGAPVNRYEMPQGGFDELMQGCFVGPMPMWRRDLHVKHGLFDANFRTAGDYEFWLRVTAAGEKMLHLPRTIGAYTYRNDSAERREKLRTLWETVRARGRYRKEQVTP